MPANPPTRFALSLMVCLLSAISATPNFAATSPLTGPGSTAPTTTNPLQSHDVLRQQQLQLQQQLVQKRQSEQLRQEQLRQQQMQYQQQVAKARSSQSVPKTGAGSVMPPPVLAKPASPPITIPQGGVTPRTTYQDPHNARIGPATGPSYPLRQDWRGNYIEIPKAVQNPVSGLGSLSTNRPATIQYEQRRIGPDLAKPLDAAKAAGNYVNTHRAETFMNGAAMLLGPGEIRLGAAGTKAALEAAATGLARKEAPKAVEQLSANVATKNGTPLAGSVRNVNPLQGKTNCVNCAVATDFMLRGHLSSALLSQPKPISEIEAVYGRKFSAPTTIDSIRQQMASAGHGAYGIVFGGRSGAPGHVFNVVNQGGVIRFLDGQTKAPAILNNGYQFFQLIRTH